MIFDNTNGIRATRGQRVTLSQDFAGLGGDVKYLRTRLDATKYIQLPAGFVFSAHAEGGYIHPLQESPGEGRDAIRITDRFFGAQMRGFDIRGIGPRVRRTPFDEHRRAADRRRDRIRRAWRPGLLHGPRRARIPAELEAAQPWPAPVGVRRHRLGVEPDDAATRAGLLRHLCRHAGRRARRDTRAASAITTPGHRRAAPASRASTTAIQESFIGNSPKPRLSVGIGVNWISPFGPLRLDLAKALLKQDGDDTKLFSFNVGTQF